MIADPLASRQHIVSGSALTAADVNLDMIANGPGRQTLRKCLSQNLAVTNIATISHSVTKSGRRRSVLRVDSTYYDASVVPAIKTTGSAYIVVDQDDSQTVNPLFARDAALSTLVNALVTSRAAGANFVPSTILTDFLNGEP
jgi:hypothetical protein